MEAFEQQLQDLWQQGGRQLAVAFLRRAVTLDMNLRNLQSALAFADAAPHLDAITLREVLAPTAAADAPASGLRAAAPAGLAPAGPAGAAPAAAAPAAPAAEAKVRRRRRSAEEVTALRRALELALLAEPGSSTTTQLVATVAEQAGDAVRVHALLRALATEGLVTDLGGRPKAWRPTAALRRAHAPATDA